jgi:glutaredoxin-like protein NrdH
MAIQHIQGKKAGNVMIYALSTCPWCKKAKKLLDDMGVEYSFIDVDLAVGAEKEETIKTVRKLNPGLSFPTIVIDDKPIVGYDEAKIKDSLKK